MPVYKDKDRGTWYCCFYYTDWQGSKKRKIKRGFTKQKEAKEYERNFLDKVQSNSQMTMASLTSLYIEDMQNRLRQSTMSNKKYLIDTKILPYFIKTKISDIKPTTIRHWQNELISQGYSETYLKTINNQLCAILNYAVKYYGLKENPCHKAGSMGRKNAKEMQFWTRDDFNTFINNVDDIQAYNAFLILYWCGLRVGELLALTKNDIDFENKTLSVNKSYQRLKGQDIITEPKTPKSNRLIALPDFLCKELKNYIDQLYDDNARLFQMSKHSLYKELRQGCQQSGVKRIRIHDLRHSHASLLIELGFSPLLIAERLGHENIETTLNTYSHLYPHKQTELACMLDTLK